MSYSMRVNMSIGIVAMVDQTAHPTAPVSFFVMCKYIDLKDSLLS